MNVLLIALAALTVGETEKEACQRLAVEMNGQTEVILPDETRVDILTPEVAWEVDWSSNWAQGIGQAVLYSIWTDREPGLILLVRDRRAEKVFILRAKLVCQRLKIRLKIERVKDAKTDP